MADVAATGLGSVATSEFRALYRKATIAMSKRIFSEHIEQIWNNKDADGIERFIAPNYPRFRCGGDHLRW